MPQRIERLKELLLQDRDALRSGEITSLAATSTVIDEIISSYEADPEIASDETQAALTEVRAIAAKNVRLLGAAIEGTKAAREQIEMIRRATTQLNTYSSNGDVTNVTAPAGKIEKRA